MRKQIWKSTTSIMVGEYFYCECGHRTMLEVDDKHMDFTLGLSWAKLMCLKCKKDFRINISNRRIIEKLK